MRDAAILTDAAVAIRGDTIVAVGRRDRLEVDFRNTRRVDCAGCILTPGLVDSHTHAVFGRPRYEEHELRAAGEDYMAIARRGGGIHASVRDVRARSPGELLRLADGRLRRLAAHGTTTVEVKSGYGLSIDAELTMLRTVRALQDALPMRIVGTWLGAHEIPPEARATDASRREWIAMLRGEMLDAVARDATASFADVFCEPGVYTVEESAAILGAARASGLGL